MDSKNKKTILVPWDFTPAAENALLHAVSLGKKFDNNVTLLHIADRGKSLSNNSKKIQETIAATNKLNELTRQYSEKCKICINSIVIEGSIFTTIADVASQLDVSLICMGTHGMKGMQKITGMISYASKKEPCMILIMVKRGINITDYIMGLDEQKLIFNQYKIPVMCINHGNKAK